MNWLYTNGDQVREALGARSRELNENAEICHAHAQAGGDVLVTPRGYLTLAAGFGERAQHFEHLAAELADILDGSDED